MLSKTIGALLLVTLATTLVACGGENKEGGGQASPNAAPTASPTN
jgi:hypothetical protein